MKKIIDEFTDLKVSRQRKWQLRNPELAKIINKRFNTSLKGLVWHREVMRKRKGITRRNLNAKSYRLERKLNETH